MATKRVAAKAFGVGLVLAIAASGGILGERLSAGSVPVGFAVNVLVTLAAVLALVVTRRSLAEAAPGGPPTAAPVVVPQVVGAIVGIAVVHTAVRGGTSGALPWLSVPWLSERPLQLVNDLVAVFAILAIVWGCAGGVSPVSVALALVLVAGYRATSGYWHFDHPPHGFEASVQQLVVAQVMGAALAIFLFRGLLRPKEV